MQSSYLTSEDVKLFHRQGFLIKKGCLSYEDCLGSLSDAVESAIERALAVAETVEWTSLDTEVSVLIDGSRVVLRRSGDGGTSIARINGVCGMAPSLANIVSSDTMLNTFFDLLGTSDMEHIIAQLHPKKAGDQVSFPMHRDIDFRRSFDPGWTDILGNGSYAICIIPIDDMNEGNGGLYIDTASYGVPEQQENIIWVDAGPGDFIFLHPHIAHGSRANTSATSNRRTLLTGFCAFGANSKRYPGACLNMRYIRYGSEGGGGKTSIRVEVCPWKDLVYDKDVNH